MAAFSFSSCKTSALVLGALVASVLILAFAAPHVVAADEDPLQDFCVADLSTTPINGFVCKNPNQVLASDFKSDFLVRNVTPINPQLGSAVTLAAVTKFAALNTQGLSIARIDFNPKGLNPPHVHPRATEVLFLVEGTLQVGFIDTTKKLFQQTIYAGDLFVFPRGLVHFQLNADDKKPALSISALNSQNPGASQVAVALFDASPSPVSEQVLETTFGIDKHEVDRLIASVKKTQ